MSYVDISWEEQVELIEFVTCATGHYCYEAARNEMHDILKQKHGRYTDLEFEPAPGNEEELLREWVESEEE